MPPEPHWSHRLRPRLEGAAGGYLGLLLTLAATTDNVDNVGLILIVGGLILCACGTVYIISRKHPAPDEADRIARGVAEHIGHGSERQRAVTELRSFVGRLDAELSSLGFDMLMRSFQHDISQETRDKMSRFSEMHQELSAIIREHEGALRAPAIIKLLDTASTNLIYASGRLLGFDPSTVESVLHDGITAPLRAAADQLDQMRLTTS